jgi:hypothetical protein
VAQGEAGGDARFGTVSRLAEFAGDVDAISDFGGAAQHGFAAWDAAAADHVHEHFVETREIAAGKR